MSRLDAYSDNSRRLGYVTCECGNRRTQCSGACARCTYLDGTREAAIVIDSMRGTDGLSISEISEMTDMGHRSIQRSLKRLVRIGRVRRYWREADTGLVSRRLFNQAASLVKRGGGDHWVYALDGKTEREWRRAA